MVFGGSTTPASGDVGAAFQRIYIVTLGTILIRVIWPPSGTIGLKGLAISENKDPGQEA